MSQPVFIQKLLEKVALGFIRTKASLVMSQRYSRDGEGGQTTIEYVMIMGLIAAIIVSIFMVMLWPVVSESVSELADKIRGAISGDGVI
jgi:Flp pilus assembly pilin Flp